MYETDCEIEYLDEDAEIVQQCVQPMTYDSQAKFASEQRLLMERGGKRKRKQDDSSDYNPSPSEDAEDEADIPMRSRKKNTSSIKKPSKSNQSVSTTSRAATVKPRSYVNKKAPKPVNEYLERKKLDIRIPDYDDPLCLPVRAQKRSGSDLQRLRSWNNLCLEHFKHRNTILRPEKGETKGSFRSVVLRNVVHKETGKQELAVWSKTSVDNQEGVRKSEIFQSILPKYRERRVLSQFNLLWSKREMRFRQSSEVVLAKEEHKGEQALVVYKPKDNVSAVYKTIVGEKKISNDGVEEDPKIILKEVVSAKVCAPCYQTSWRGHKKNNQSNIRCPICSRASVSVYNLLTHVKAHQPQDVKRYKTAISQTLAKVVDYHYRCRVCLQKFLSIKSLREHVNTHKGTEMFKCEVGNHMAT